jgi:hypothetical protein
VLWSFLYLAVCRLFELLMLRARSTAGKELEILVLRHELAIARRRLARPQPSGPCSRPSAVRSRALAGQPVGCVNSIALQIGRFRAAAEFAHPTPYSVRASLYRERELRPGDAAAADPDQPERALLNQVEETELVSRVRGSDAYGLERSRIFVQTTVAVVDQEP